MLTRYRMTSQKIGLIGCGGGLTFQPHSFKLTEDSPKGHILDRIITVNSPKRQSYLVTTDSVYTHQVYSNKYELQIRTSDLRSELRQVPPIR